MWRLSHASLALAVRSYHGRLQAALHFDLSHTTGLSRLCEIAYTTVTKGSVDVRTWQNVSCLRNARSGPKHIFWFARIKSQGQTSSPCWSQKLTQLSVPNHFRPTTASITCMCRSVPVTSRRQRGYDCLILVNGPISSRSTVTSTESSLVVLGHDDSKVRRSPRHPYTNGINPIAA